VIAAEKIENGEIAPRPVLSGFFHGDTGLYSSGIILDKVPGFHKYLDAAGDDPSIWGEFFCLFLHIERHARMKFPETYPSHFETLHYLTYRILTRSALIYRCTEHESEHWELTTAGESLYNKLRYGKYLPY